MLLRRNRKKRQLNGFMFATPVAGVAIAIVLLGLAYIWLGCRCEQIGTELKKLEEDREQLQTKLKAEQANWARIRSPVNIEATLKRMGILMIWPKASQVVRVTETDMYLEVTAGLADTSTVRGRGRARVE